MNADTGSMGFDAKNHPPPPSPFPSHAAAPSSSGPLLKSGSMYSECQQAYDMPFGILLKSGSTHSDANKHVTSVIAMQSDSGIMTRVSSFPFEGVDHPASPFSAPTSNLRSTPFEWGSPSATAHAAASEGTGIVTSEAVREAPWHDTGVQGYGSRAEPSSSVSERSSPRARFATASGGPSALVSGNASRG